MPRWIRFVLLPVLVLAVLLTVAMARSAASASQADGAPALKVLAAPGVLRDRAGVELWHDYGAFGLYRVDTAVWPTIAADVRAAADVLSGDELLMVGGRPFDTQDPAATTQRQLAADESAGPALHLIQFVGPIKDEWLASVRAAGAEPVQYLASNGYLVWADAAARRRLDVMAAGGDVVQYSGPFLVEDRLAPALRRARGDGGTAVEVTIQMLRHADEARTQRIIKETALAIGSGWEPVLAFQNLTAIVARRDIAQLAALPDVVWINERLPREKSDEIQTQIMAGNLDATGQMPVGPGYLAWLQGLGFSSDPADYPIVDIVDDGVGNGSIDSGDATLHVGGSAGQPSRLAYVSNCTTAVDGSGPGGHGHLNISIAGGFDGRSGSPFQDADGYQRGMGVNPYGRFASTRVFNVNFELDNCGDSDLSLLQHSYELGARISSNSWGCGDCAAVYDESSQAFDTAVRDADPSQAGNQPMSVVVAAGNYGPTSGTVSTPGNGKNIVSVGASENIRPTWIDGCAVGPSEADDLDDIASFSSRGPVPGQRVKPDIVAPGTHVQGTASTSPAYIGSSVCDKFQPANQTTFAASSGTSHSTPAVAGALSLMDYWLRENLAVDAPSPALLKAFLLAHTAYLDGVFSGDDLPSNSQGYGMPDLGAAFDATPRVLVDQSAARTFGATGETWTLTGAVADPARPVRIVLAFTDQPGMVGSSPQVNDLNLTAELDNQTYVGNQFDGAWSAPGGTADAANNVEAIYLPAGTSGPFTVTVTAANIAGDGVPGNGDATDQDFALVCSNCAQEADFSLKAEANSVAICVPGSASATVTATGRLGYSDDVALSVAGMPEEVTAVFDPSTLTPTAAANLQLQAAGGATPGDYPLSIVGTASDRVRSTPLALRLATAVPGLPQPVAPLAGAVVGAEDVVLSWTAVAQAQRYDVQVATDAGFSQVVASGQGVEDVAFAPAGLQPGTVYVWRVRAANACGEGAWSVPASFETEPLPGACGPGQETAVVYQQDFESGRGGWSSTGTGDTWQLSEARSASDDWAMHAEDVATISDQRLSSPAIDLPEDAAALTLQFWNYQEIEWSDDERGECYDGALVEVSVNGGSYEPVDGDALLTDPYDGPVSIQFLNPLSGEQAWCGDPQDWLLSVVDLSAYAGERVRFRFRLGTDEVFGREGWYVDDVVVQACRTAVVDAYLPVVVRP